MQGGTHQALNHAVPITHALLAAELGALLGVPAEKAEAVASRMVMEDRLQVGAGRSGSVAGGCWRRPALQLVERGMHQCPGHAAAKCQAPVVDGYSLPDQAKTVQRG